MKNLIMHGAVIALLAIGTVGVVAEIAMPQAFLNRNQQLEQLGINPYSVPSLWPDRPDFCPRPDNCSEQTPLHFKGMFSPAQ